MSVQLNPLNIICIDLDQCSQTNPACGASQPCSNNFGLAGTWNTCTYQCSYECTVNSYYFTNCRIPVHIQAALGVTNYSISVVSQSHVPNKWDWGKTISRRESFKFCVASLEDCNDVFGGTPLQRLISAQGNLEGRRVRTWFGHCGNTLSEMEQQTYVIKSVSGPSGSDCRYCIEAVDLLSPLKNIKVPDNAQKLDTGSIPIALTTGALLPGPDDDPESVVGQFILNDNLLNDMSDQAKRLRQAKYLCVDGEIVPARPTINNTIDPGYNFEILGRGACGSEIKEHKAGAKVSIPLVFQAGDHIADVIRRLMSDSGDLRESMLLCCDDDNAPIVDWQSIEDLRCKEPLYTLGQDVIICEPVSIDDLLDELSESFPFFSIYSENGVIKLASLCPGEGECETLRQAEVQKATESSRSVGERATNVVIQHTVDDWSKSPGTDNLLDSTVYVGEDFLRAPCDRRCYPDALTKTVESRWIGPANSFAAESAAFRWAEMLKRPALEMCITTTTDVARRFPMGQLAVLNIEKNRDWTGEYSTDKWAVVGRQKIQTPKDICMELCFRKLPFGDEMKSCLSCDFLIPPEGDECNPNCLRVW